MIDKALMIMVFMWTLSFSVLGVEYIIGDVVGWELTVQCSDGCDEYGQPIKPYLVNVFSEGGINSILLRASGGSYTNSDQSTFDKVINFSTAAAHVGWDIVLLLTGTYIFQFIYYLGVPWIFATGFGVLYSIFLIRAIVGYIRGV